MPRTALNPSAENTLKRSKMLNISFGAVPVPVAPTNINVRATVVQIARDV